MLSYWELVFSCLCLYTLVSVFFLPLRVHFSIIYFYLPVQFVSHAQTCGVTLNTQTPCPLHVRLVFPLQMAGWGKNEREEQNEMRWWTDKESYFFFKRTPFQLLSRHSYLFSFASLSLLNATIVNISLISSNTALVRRSLAFSDLTYTYFFPLTNTTIVTSPLGSTNTLSAASNARALLKTRTTAASLWRSKCERRRLCGRWRRWTKVKGGERKKRRWMWGEACAKKKDGERGGGGSDGVRGKELDKTLTRSLWVCLALQRFVPLLCPLFWCRLFLLPFVPACVGAAETAVLGVNEEDGDGADDEGEDETEAEGEAEAETKVGFATRLGFTEEGDDEVWAIILALAWAQIGGWAAVWHTAGAMHSWGRKRNREGERPTENDELFGVRKTNQRKETTAGRSNGVERNFLW